MWEVGWEVEGLGTDPEVKVKATNENLNILILKHSRGQLKLKSAYSY